MAASSSSSSGSDWKYDVFLSFRGEDTRRIFVSHLYKALNQKALNTFIDSEELRKGNELSELLKAIQESRLSLVIFSENYASSTWCLKELVQILKCMDTQKQIVVPIFYQVEPSHIRKLKASFGEALAKNEGDSAAEMEEMQTWRSALTRATNLSGWHSTNYQDDAKLMEDIVEVIFKKLIHISAIRDDGLVGMDSHMNEMEKLLCPSVADVRFVGIWGMGGIGKTTIARTIYNKFAGQFEHCCFLENIKEGDIHLQEELLSRMLKGKRQTFSALDKGFKMVMERLSRKKVLLVLDGVDRLDQIEILLGKKPSFGGGSRIIITTRDYHLLSGFQIYKPELLSDGEALELFRQYAFRTSEPSPSYHHLSRRAIEYAHGVPLALKVLGAFLHNKSAREWEDQLEKIKRIPDPGIQGVLRTSFDGLDDSQKSIFLDIACFFRGMNKDFVTEFLDSCGFFPHCGLRVLVDRALITISPNVDTLEMHDLLQEMGRELGRLSRVWSYEDVDSMLSQNMAMEAVEGIVLDLKKSKEVYINTEAFVSMTKLRLLKLDHNRCPTYHYINESFTWVDLDHPALDEDCKQHVSGELKFLSRELRILIWHGSPLKSLPANFHPKNLVYLDMSHCHLEQLWEGTKPLKNLEYINLSYSQYLRKLPDLTEATNLKKVILEGCISLLEVHPSFSALENLVFWSLNACKELKILSSSSNMKSLQILNLSGCSNLERSPDTSEVMKELSKLYLDGTAIKELPPSINNLPGIVTLSLKGCRELKILPSSIHMKSLKHLCLSGCSKLDNFPKISGVMKELSELYLDETAIKELPSSIERLPRLAKLSMRNCRSLVFLPENICKLTCLEELHLEGCKRLKSIPEISSSINYIDAHNCTDLETVSTPMHLYNSRPCFIFSNCHKLEIPYAESRSHDHDHDQVDRWRTFSFMTLPGSKIPEWFNHQCEGSSVTVQIPPNWFDNDVMGFAVCAVSNFQGPLGSAKCVFTFTGNHGECSYTFELLDWPVSHRLLESDHVLMGIETGLTRGDWYVDRDYTEAEFSVMVDAGVYEDSCIKSCGVCFFDVSTEESTDDSAQDYTDGAGRNKKIKR